MSILYKSAGPINHEEAEFLAINLYLFIRGIVLTFMTKAPIIFEYGSHMPDSVLMTQGCFSGKINVTVIPLTEGSYVKKGERELVIEGDKFIERFCFELGSEDGIDYMKVEVADAGAWLINVW